jgi:acyl carrier protein
MDHEREPGYAQLLHRIATELTDPDAIHAQVMGLATPAAAAPAGGTAVAAADGGHAVPTELEGHVLELWRAVLGVPQVSLDDGFLDVGGDSLTATQVLARIEAEFGVELALDELLDLSVTPRRLAEIVRAATGTKNG